jgi:uncharacterized membrane protein HdeD (DUF308 family)
MLLAALMVLLGAILAFYSKESDPELRIALTGYLALHAIASLILASSLRQEASTWLAIPIGAIVDVLLATLMLAQWPSVSGWVLGLYLGVNLSVAGLALIFVALGVRDHIGRGKASMVQANGASRQPYRRFATRKDRQHDQQTRG